VHAYVLMGNHVHLLVTPADEGGPGRMMQAQGRRYVRYFNDVYGRTGTLWEGRFKSCLVESSRYVLGCHRYIECNPVRAGMVTHAGIYRWSSYQANVGLSEDALLTPHVEYRALGLSDSSTRAAYRSLFETPEDPALLKAIREATHGGYPLVGDALKQKLARQARRTLARGKPGPAPKGADSGLSGSLPFDGDPVLTPN